MAGFKDALAKLYARKIAFNESTIDKLTIVEAGVTYIEVIEIATLKVLFRQVYRTGAIFRCNFDLSLASIIC